MQYLTGRAWFRKIDVQVGPGVFIPRPETEAVVHFALDQLLNLRADTGPSPVIVDLGTGSGVIAKSILSEYPGTPRMYAVERSPQALEWARRNLADTPATVVAGDMADALPQLEGKVDLVISNPPYLPAAHADELPADVLDYDPHEALFGGDDGLETIRGIVPVATRLLRPGGCSSSNMTTRRAIPRRASSRRRVGSNTSRTIPISPDGHGSSRRSGATTWDNDAREWCANQQDRPDGAGHVRRIAAGGRLRGRVLPTL